MTSRIIFSNPGEIDPRLITLMGVNVKPQSSNPIGFFGTGLKYAIAVAARLNQRVTILTGADKTMTFERLPVSLRGKDFDQIVMTTVTATPQGGAHTSRQHLGFTTELGKQWEPWMAYREFYCNAVDEEGSTDESTVMPQPKAGWTYIVVEGAEFAKAHRERSSWLLEGRPLITMSELGYTVELHPGPRREVFYQGIKVHTWGKSSMFTWNFTSKVELSEDRQAKETWELQRQIIQVVVRKCTDKALLKKMILAPEGTLEAGFNWNHAWDPSIELIELVNELFDSNYAKLPPSLLELLRGQIKNRVPQAVALTKVQQMILDKAKNFLAKMGHPVTEEIIIVESLGSQWIAGLAKEGRIFLPLSSFGKGTKFIASTLLEEHLHCSLGLHDCSREMQDWLFDKVLSLAEEATGEPL